MRLTSRYLRILALLILIVAAVVIVMLPGPPSACHVLPGEVDPSGECGQEGVFTAARIATGAVAIVAAVGLWIAATIRDAV